MLSLLMLGLRFVLTPSTPRDGHRAKQPNGVAEYHEGSISFAELEASILGWTRHVAHADSWGLRRHMLDGLAIRPAEHRRALTRRG